MVEVGTAVVVVGLGGAVVVVVVDVVVVEVDAAVGIAAPQADRDSADTSRMVGL